MNNYQLRILELNIENFKGINKLKIQLNGDNCNIYGDNKTGKTTIYDAWLWLLFDKDSQNRNDFPIKPIQDGKVKHNIESSVEAIIKFGNKEYSLRKVFSEKWTKKRGSARAQFTGHTTNYYINSVPSKKSEYTSAINNIIDEDKFKILSNPLFFNEQLSWQERRRFLFEIAGFNMSDKEIAEKNGFSDLANIFGKYTPENYKKILSDRKQSINRVLKSIPIRIDELEKTIPNLEGNEKDLQESIGQLQKKIADLQTDDVKAKAEKKIYDLRQTVLIKQQDILKKTNDLEAKKINILSLERTIEGVQESINEYKKSIEDKRNLWYQTNNKTADIKDICPTCKQKLPEHKIQEAIDAFNVQKDEDLRKINEEGKTLRKTYERLLSEKKQFEKELDQAKTLNSKIDKQIADLKNTSFPENAAISSLQASLNFIDTNHQETEQSGQIEELNIKLQEKQNELAQIEAAKQTKRRIEELSKQEKDLSAQFLAITDNLIKLENFTRMKAEMLENSVNDKFNIADFKLFNNQINGGVEETCLTKVNGVPYTGINNAAKIQVGLDIIKTLQEFYKIQIPIFVDNRESVTTLPDMNKTQIINLIVSAKDKKLRIEGGLRWAKQ